MKKESNNLRSVFSKAVEELAAKQKISVIEALAAIQEEMHIDTDEIPSVITDHLRERIAAEAIKLNMLRGKPVVIEEFFGK